MPTISFDKVMDFHPGNRDVYREIRDNLDQLIPFVGAGLTAPVYGGWAKSIEGVSEIIASEGTRKRLAELAKADPLEAAQLLEDTIGKVNLCHRLAHYFSRDKLVAGWDAIKGGALWLLPDLFPCPVLTTNFDEAIETVYLQRGFVPFPTLDPTSPDLRGQAVRLRNTPCAFKLHGTVSGSMVDYSRIVFTRSQYEVHYAPGGEVRKALRAFIGVRGMLFLGCSLRGDETVKVLEEEMGPGVMHFAIASCLPDERDKRVRELADAGIRAILCEDGKHDSVRAVLEQMLQELHPEIKSAPLPKSSRPAPDGDGEDNAEVLLDEGKKIQILMLAGGQDPTNMLRLDHEAKSIHMALDLASHGDLIALKDRWAVTVVDFFREINRVKPEIIHFSGHGAGDGSIMLEDEHGEMMPVSPEAMAKAVAATCSVTKLLVFNACFGEAQATKVVGHVGAAIGMSAPIGDEAAILFAHTLYSAIAFGHSLQKAFDQAVAALAMRYPDQQNVPRLHVAAGKDASQIYFT